jgi:hypothetical protein
MTDDERIQYALQTVQYLPEPVLGYDLYAGVLQLCRDKEFSEALRCSRELYQVGLGAGDTYVQGIASFLLGSVYFALGGRGNDCETAADHYRASARLFHTYLDANAEHNEGVVWLTLGRLRESQCVRMDKNKWEEAIESYQNAAKLLGQRNDTLASQAADAVRRVAHDFSGWLARQGKQKNKSQTAAAFTGVANGSQRIWEEEGFIEIPIMEAELAAGEPIAVGEDTCIGVIRVGSAVLVGDQQFLPVNLDGTTYLNIFPNYQYVVARVRGRSMDRARPVPIQDKNLVILRKSQVGIYEPQNGHIVAAILPDIADRRGILKRFRRVGNVVRLESESSLPDLPQHQPREYTVTQSQELAPVHVVAQAVAVLRSLGKVVK